ncbi:ROK family protein [Brachybacterium sp. JHP9]|uniref:ROK family protein n=1 Tax=Brachybacterium equifaecis TaxID=2910770 RepID=A0ABT0QX16_9MICO|nr:ROK family protein [Brachybacterium equifaecis]MCL6422232.1 ROK family protein [Brachybacterium equifaecis]
MGTTQKSRTAFEPGSARGQGARPRAVLEFAWGAGAFLTADAVSATGLARSAAIAQCTALVEAGWLAQLPNAREAGTAYRAGRPSLRFAFRSDTGLVIGVDAGKDHVGAVLTDLAGAVLASERRDVPAALADPGAPDLAGRRALIEQLIARVQAAGPAPHAPVLATVIGVPAPCDPQGRSPREPNALWELVNPGLIDLLSAPGQVIVDNDANLAALAEGTVGAAQGSASSATLLTGERFGSGLLIDGQVVRGRHGRAGELAVMELVSGVGEAYGLGALARRWLEQDQAAGVVPLASPLARLAQKHADGETVLLAAQEGDPYAGELLSRMAQRLARIVAVLAGLLDVETVVIAGAPAAAIDGVLDQARPLLASLLHAAPPRLVASPLGREGVARGAAVRGIAAVREAALTGASVGELVGASAL